MTCAVFLFVINVFAVLCVLIFSLDYFSGGSTALTGIN